VEELIRYIENYVHLSKKAEEALEQFTTPESFKKNEFILQPGQYCQRIWFLVSGMVRKFHLSDGKEITSWIHTENETFTSLQSYAQDTPSTEYLQACEPVTAISISKKKSKELIVFPEFVTFTNALMEKQFALIDQNTREFNNRDAKGKYAYLQQIAPQLIKRAKLGHIASLLGVTQETLSRIRRV